ncbi:MAG: DUF402 domain-containing protein [Actinocatenispora sp.]
MANFFEPGRVVEYRAYFGSALSQVTPVRVVRHDEDGLLTWLAPGTPLWRLTSPDGPLRDVPREQWPTRLVPASWSGNGILQWTPPDAAHAVWWFWRADGSTDVAGFEAWYVNLERHEVCLDDRTAGIDVVDQELDGVLSADRRWVWKDEESFADKTGHPAFWSAAEAEAVRAEGERVRAVAEAGGAPFDGRWCDFTPAPDWTLPERPAYGWDRAALLDAVWRDPGA